MAKYSYEFKKKIVKAYLEGKGGCGYLANQYGIPNKCIVRRWIKAYETLGDEGLKRSRKNEEYTFEYKLHVVELYLSSEVSYQELAKQEGFNNPSILSKWVNDFLIAGPDALRPKKKGRKKALDSIDYGKKSTPAETVPIDTSAEHIKQLEDGLNVSGLVLDEVHAQPNRKLYDVLTKGSGDAREQPLYFLITTAGNDTNSICYELHQKALDIIEGRKTDPTFYPVIYGAADGDDWTDPKVWKKANPSLGETIQMEKVVAACESAKQNPAEENSFRQLRLNQWVKQAVRWMPMDKWDACAFPVNEDDLEGRVCYGGLDLSSTTDLTSFCLVFPPLDENDKYYVLPYFWLPEETLDLRVRRDHVNYDVWERQGYIQTTEGNVVHYGYIEKFIERLGERFNIREIAFDRWGAVQMVQNLEGMGFNVVAMGQGFASMSPPTKELMKLTLEQRIAHGGHPVLRWNMDNIFIRTDPAGNIKADKSKSTEKIDGAIACIMALDRAIRCGNDTSESVYDTRGLLVF